MGFVLRILLAYCFVIPRVLYIAGNCSSESLLEMIALHLDAVFAEYKTWREFALCFLKVSQKDEDRMSVCLNGNEGGQKQQFSVRQNRIPKLFIHGKSGRAWKLRYRWWLRRHFSRSMLSSDITTGIIASSLVHPKKFSNTPGVPYALPTNF